MSPISHVLVLISCQCFFPFCCYSLPSMVEFSVYNHFLVSSLYVSCVCVCVCVCFLYVASFCSMLQVTAEIARRPTMVKLVNAVR